MKQLAEQLLLEGLDFQQLRLGAIEISEKLRSLQQATWAPLRAKGISIAHLNDLSVLAEADSPQWFFSNEFVDAFPARQLIYHQGTWLEVYLDLDHPDGPGECALPPPQEIDFALPSRVREGLRVFGHSSYREWLQKLPGAGPSGMLTIDYGRAYPASECRGYRNQQRLQGSALLAQAGHCDLTCDVNFADLRAWGEAHDWQTLFCGTLAEFLETLLPARNRARIDDVEARLRHPLDAGGAFYVLYQIRD